MNIKKWFLSIDRNILYIMWLFQFISALVILNLSYTMWTRFQGSFDLMFFVKHMMFIFISNIIMFSVSYFTIDRKTNIMFYIFYFFLILTFLTRIIGPEINTTKRWIMFAGISIQPSEIVKNLAIYISAHLLSQSKHKYNLILLGVMLISCLIQPDLGMSLLILLSVSFEIFLCGEYLKEYLSVLIVGLVSIILTGIFFASYFYNRILIFINTLFGNKIGFQIQQSFKSIYYSSLLGSGKPVYIPDAHCDFVFAELTNQLGLLIALLVAFCPIYLFYKVIQSSVNKKLEQKMIMLGIVFQFTTQVYIHILSNLSLIPTKGMTLPFISFGGSSMIAYGFSFGVLLSITKKVNSWDE